MAVRLAHVVNTYGMGGAELFVVDLVRRGEQRGFDQLVLNPFARPFSAEFADLVRPVRHEAKLGDGLLAAPALRRWLRSQLRDFRPDVVHTLLFPATVAMATVPVPAGATRLLTHMYGPGLRVAPHGRVKQPLDRWAVRRFDHVVAISESVKDHLTSAYGYPASSVTVIPLGWEGDPRPRVEDDRPPTVVCVAHFRPEKGHAVLLEAFGVVRDQLPDARLVLVGRGELESAVRRQIQALGLGANVDLTGPVDDVWAVLARADVFALPSLSEAYGIAVAEAMAAGLPVVASAVGGVPELVTEGVTGALFPAGDHQALARHLISLLASPVRSRQMGDAARAAAQPLRRARSLDRHLDLCEHLAAAGRQEFRR